MQKIRRFALPTLLLLTVSEVIAADTEKDFSGHRFGMGYSGTGLVDFNSQYAPNWGDGIKIEYGYSFNRIIGVNLSYQGYDDKIYYQDQQAELKGDTYKLDTDIGYFYQGNGIDSKLYVAIGIAHIKESLKGRDNPSLGFSSSEESLLLGVGLRLLLEANIYTDIRYDYFNLDKNDRDQLSFTLGAKF